jgi:hypothetical protein
MQRTERIRIIVTGEYFRSGSSQTWMLNEARTKFITKADEF